MKDILHSSMLQAYPMLHAQSVHDSGVGGGWSNINAFTIGDINRLIRNEIAGASLTCVDNGDATLVLTTPGDGKTSAPINNPANGTHLDLCYITLPVGTYVLVRSCGNSGATSGESQFYNRSDSVSLWSWTSFLDGVTYGREISLKFTVTGGSKQFNVRKIYNAAHTASVSDWGDSPAYNAGGQNIHDDIKIYKIG
jgi:hypothetical protein